MDQQQNRQSQQGPLQSGRAIKSCTHFLRFNKNKKNNIETYLKSTIYPDSFAFVMLSSDVENNAAPATSMGNETC